MDNNIKVIADFSGGLDLVFNGSSQIVTHLPEQSTISSLIALLSSQHANQKKEMFAINEKIRPGILVLINDVDWQLAEKEQTLLSSGDKVSFISTLHGG